MTQTQDTQPADRYAGHTPGPLKCALAFQDNGANYYAITTGKWGAPTIATVSADNEADGRLFAAAPKLLAENRRLREALRAIAEKSWSTLCSDNAAEEMQDHARAALADTEVES